MSKNWQLQEAKNKFSQVVDCACNEGPQIVTRHGKETVVILSLEDDQELLKPQNALVDFFAASPLKGLNLDLERNASAPRPVDL
ncbi:MAG: type II toxin-antitoxin system Phd/YefM family antitoxin [Candidatus Sericytochromatia bacterium]|nr:type II toxin-antitoxin system Phd/YefM family antitoxin [Candidatus Sericytochromatia bacterium]